MESVFEDGKIPIHSDILKALNIEEGDFIEQHVVKNGVIVLKKLEGERLQMKILEVLNNIQEELHQMKSHCPNNHLLSLLFSIEQLIEEYKKHYSQTEYKNITDTFHIMPEEKDLLILEVIAKGENSLSGIAETLNLPVSSVSESLNNLCAQGLVDFSKVNDGKRGRPKHVYYLTMFGEQFYQENF